MSSGEFMVGPVHLPFHLPLYYITLEKAGLESGMIELVTFTAKLLE